MPVQDGTPEEWRKLTQGDEGSIYIGPAKRPDDVLKKLYYKNALELVPGMPRAGFPN